MPPVTNCFGQYAAKVRPTPSFWPGAYGFLPARNSASKALAATERVSIAIHDDLETKMRHAMKTLLACIVGMTISAMAQVPSAGADHSATVKSAKLLPVSESDIYCGGFITKEGVSLANYIGGGWSNPSAACIASG